MSGKIQRRATRSQLHSSGLTIISEDRKMLRETQETAKPAGLGYELSKEAGTSCCGNGDAPMLCAAAARESDGAIGDDIKLQNEFDKICAKLLGHELDYHMKWEDSGLSSMALVELTNMIEESYLITLSQDCFELYRDRIPSTTPGAEPPRDVKDSGSARSHSTHLETSSSNRP